jgi:hypothetical protein
LSIDISYENKREREKKKESIPNKTWLELLGINYTQEILDLQKNSSID